MREALFAAIVLFSAFLGTSTPRATEVHDVAPGKRPAIVADSSGHLYAVFEALSPMWREKDIFYCESKDGGSTWTFPHDISNTSTDSLHPNIAVEKNGALDVVWADTKSGDTSPDVFFTRSTDGGKTWTELLDISNTPGASSDPALAIGPDNAIHVVWCDTSKGEKNRDIYYCYSSDGGKKWAKDPLLPAVDISNTKGMSNSPTIAVDEGGVVHAAWADTSSGETKPDIYYASSANGTWCKPTDVSNTSGISAHPSIACGAKEKVYLCWSDNSLKPKAPDIWCAIGDKSGHFAEPINITNTPGVSSEPVIAADGAGQLGVIWCDTSKTFTKPDIYGRVSLDKGADFSNVMDLSNTPGVSKHPCATISGDKMFIVWEDIEGGKSKVKITSMVLKEIATGPPTDVEQSIHGVSSDSR